MRSVGGWTEAEKQKKHRPQGIVDAEFSIPFTVAATLVNGRLSLEEFNDANLRNEKILALAGRVTPVLDRELDNWPLDVKPQIVEIVTRNGKCLRQRIDYPKGNPKNPVTSAELVESFRVMARYSARPLTYGKIDEAIDFILHLETKEKAAMMTRFLVA